MKYRKLFLIVLDARKSKTKAKSHSVYDQILCMIKTFLLCPHRVEDRNGMDLTEAEDIRGGWERPEVFLFCSGDPLTVWLFPRK